MQRSLIKPIGSNAYRKLPNGAMQVGSGLFGRIRRGFKSVGHFIKKHKLTSKSLAELAELTGNKHLAAASRAAKTVGLGKTSNKYRSLGGGKGYVVGGSLWGRIKHGFKKVHHFAKKHHLTSRGLTWLASHTKDPRLLIAARAARSLGYGSKGGFLMQSRKCKCKGGPRIMY